jgi:hypothetical protein
MSAWLPKLACPRIFTTRAPRIANACCAHVLLGLASDVVARIVLILEFYVKSMYGQFELRFPMRPCLRQWLCRRKWVGLSCIESQPMAPKVKAIDATYENANKKPKKDGGMSESEFNASVEKAIFDNLRTLSAQELDGNRDGEGHTCRDRLVQRKRKHHESPKGNPLGKVFYAYLRTTFQNAESPKRKLEDAAALLDTPINPLFLDAMMAFKKNGNRSGVLSYVSLAEALTESELFGLMSFAMELVPTGSASVVLQQCYSVCECFGRLQVKRDFPLSFELIQSWVDDVLCQVLQSAKGTKLRPSVFVDTHSTVLYLCLPRAETELVINHDGAWVLKEAELVKIVNGSKIGAKLFGFAISQVLGEIVTRDTQVVMFGV